MSIPVCIVNSFKSFAVWLHAILAAAVAGGASGVTAAVVDPAHFNFHEGFKPLTAIVGVNALIGVAAVLKQSPLPTNCPPSASSK